MNLPLTQAQTNCLRFLIRRFARRRCGLHMTYRLADGMAASDKDDDLAKGAVVSKPQARGLARECPAHDRHGHY